MSSPDPQHKDDLLCRGLEDLYSTHISAYDRYIREHPSHTEAIPEPQLTDQIIGHGVKSTIEKFGLRGAPQPRINPVEYHYYAPRDPHDPLPFSRYCDMLLLDRVEYEDRMEGTKSDELSHIVTDQSIKFRRERWTKRLSDVEATMGIFKYYGTFQDEGDKNSKPFPAFLGPFVQVKYERPTLHTGRPDGSEEISPGALRVDEVDLYYPLDLMIPEPGSLSLTSRTLAFSRPMCERAISHLNSRLTQQSGLDDFELAGDAANWESLEDHVNNGLLLAAGDCGRYLTNGSRPPGQIPDPFTRESQPTEGPTLIRELTVGDRTLQVHRIPGPSVKIQSSRGNDVDVKLHWLPIRTLQGCDTSLKSAAHTPRAVPSTLRNRCSATRCETGSAGVTSSLFVC